MKHAMTAIVIEYRSTNSLEIILLKSSFKKLYYELFTCLQTIFFKLSVDQK